MRKSRILGRLVTGLLVAAVTAPFSAVDSSAFLAAAPRQSAPLASALQHKMAIEHTQMDYVVAGKRIEVEAAVRNEPAKLVRCYFKMQDRGGVSTVFSFVEMSPKHGAPDIYTATIPAPAFEDGKIQYTFMAVNEREGAVRSPMFSSALDKWKPAPSWQKVKSTEELKVFSELPGAEAPVGFQDRIVMDIVNESLRYGYKMDLYSAERISSALNSSSTQSSNVSNAANEAATSSASSSGASGFGKLLMIGGVTAGAVALSSGLSETDSSSSSSSYSSSSLSCTTVSNYSQRCPTLKTCVYSSCGSSSYYEAGGRRFYYDVCSTTSINNAAQAAANYCVN